MFSLFGIIKKLIFKDDFWTHIVFGAGVVLIITAIIAILVGTCHNAREHREYIEHLEKNYDINQQKELDETDRRVRSSQTFRKRLRMRNKEVENARNTRAKEAETKEAKKENKEEVKKRLREHFDNIRQFLR